MKDHDKDGVVYILTNPSFREYVKIGYADDMQKRLRELNRSECIPYAFRVFATYRVKERLSDIAIHKMIDKINPNLRTIETFDGKERKKEFYAMSADDAYDIFKTIATLSSTTDRLSRCTPEGHEILDEKMAAEVESENKYFEEDHLVKGNESTKKLYQKVRTEVLKFGDVIIEPKKFYIAFKSPKNFIDCEIQKSGLKIFINLSKGELKDLDGLADDVSDVGHWGNGDYRVYIRDENELLDCLPLFKQSYDAQHS